MRLNRFFTPRKNLRINSSVKLEDSDVKHIRKVLRLSKGENIIIFNGEDEYSAELTLVTREVVTAKLKELLKSEKASEKGSVNISIFQGLLRAGKFDFIIEKVTELGASNIVPVECEFSQMKSDAAANKVTRWQKIAVAAAKQSERVSVPEVFNPISFEDILKAKEEFDEILFFTIPRKNIPESLESKNLDLNSLNSKKKIAIIIGPEGGFSPKEHKFAKENGFKFVTVGNNVLRSETAAIIFTSLVKFLLDLS